MQKRGRESRRKNKWEESRQEKVKYLGQQLDAMQMLNPLSARQL